MKKHNFMLASLLILVGMGAITVSCKKEQVIKSRKAQVEVVTLKEGEKMTMTRLFRAGLRRNITLRRLITHMWKQSPTRQITLLELLIQIAMELSNTRFRQVFITSESQFRESPLQLLRILFM